MAPRNPPGIVTVGLGKRYKSSWALQGCTVSVPRGRITALIGANGAGKTTLLKILAGLSAPTEGTVEVLGRPPGQEKEFLDSVGYLAQDVPLYRRLSAADHLSLCARMNRHWDAGEARERLARLGIPDDRPVSTLSGGQRAQVGLSLVLAKRPRLLLLDEPVASLDPLARHDFLTSLIEAAAARELSVIMSSHLLHDLEQVCDHMILLTGSRISLHGDLGDVLNGHRVLVGTQRELADAWPGLTVINSALIASRTHALARVTGQVPDPGMEVTAPTLEDIVLAYMTRDRTLAARQRPRNRQGS
jgi:ABC-2 type transport system ATP-binding protein